MNDLVLNMQNYLLADAIKGALREGSSLRVHSVAKAEEIAETCRILQPCALLMESTGYPPCTFAQRMEIRNAVRSVAPHCKIFLLCDENAEKDVAYQVKMAKQDGLIDGFFYASVSAAYLAAALDTL